MTEEYKISKQHQYHTIGSLIEDMNGKDNDGIGFYIPDFQRFFCWDSKQVTNLFNSIIQKQIIPSIMLWKTNLDVPYIRAFNEMSDEVVNLTTYSTPKNTGVKNIYIIDGQQRLTSIFALYKGAKIAVEKDTDLEYSNKNPEIIDFKEFYVKINGLNYNDKDIILYNNDYHCLSYEDSKDYIPLYKIIRTDGIMDNILKLSKNSKKVLTISQIYNTFSEESISQEIYITDNLPYIQDVYKNINTGGKTLNTEENSWSQLFKMKSLENDFFSFKHKSIDLSNQIFQKYGIILKPVFILNATAYCLSGNIFTNTILSLSLEEVIEQWDLICKSITESVEFMKKQFHIENSSGLGNMIIAFSKFFYEKNTDKDLSLKQIKYLKSFYYTLMFRNDKDTLTRMKDLELYSKWMNNIAKGNFESFSNYIEYPTFENFTDYNTVIFKDNSSLKSKVLQAYKSLMFERNPLSLVSGNIINDDSLESKDKLNLDHIFPKANKGKKANNIFNIAILDFDTNRDKAVKAPSTVFSFPNQKGYEEGYEFNNEIKKSHFLEDIPDEIYINDKYDDFVKLRSQNMFNYLESEFFSL